MATNKEFNAKNGLSVGSTPSLVIDSSGVWQGGAIPATKGGTGLTSTTQGGILYGGATNTTTFTAAGTSGQVLKSNGTSAPTWADASTLTAGSATTATNIAGGTTNQLHYQTGAGATSFVTNNATATKMYLSQTSSGVPTYAQIAEADIADGSTYTRLAGNEAVTGTWTFNTNLPTSTITPTTTSQFANKGYVDAIAAGLDFKQSVKAATTAALTATYNNGTAGVGATLTNAGTLAALTLDGVTLAVNDRVLIKNQAAALQNGIYTVTTVGSGSVAWVLTRATDADNSPFNEVSGGMYMFIDQGTTLAESGWVMSAPHGDAVLGTDALTFVQYSQAGTITASNVGSSFATVFVQKTGTNLEFKRFDVVNNGTMQIENGVDTIKYGLSTLTDEGGGTFQKFTRDLYGRISGSSAVAASDITGLVDGTYVNVAGDTMTGRMFISRTSAATEDSLRITVGSSNANQVHSIYGIISADASANGTYDIFGARFVTKGVVSSGITNSGYWLAIRSEVMRNYITAGDTGTLTTQIGVFSAYGHYNFDASTPTTTNSAGFVAQPYAGPGTITNLGGFVWYPTSLSNATITTNVGFDAQAQTIGGTIIGYRGSIAAAAGRWNLYMTGDAANYINGNLLLGSNTASSGNEKLQVTGSIKADNLRAWYQTRTLPTTVNDCVDIGTFSFSNAGHNLDVAITVAEVGITISKRYSINTFYSQGAGAWMIVAPTHSSGVYAGHNFQLEASVSTNILTLRIRRTAGAVAGTAKIHIQNKGDTADVFTSSTTVTAAAPAITAYLSSSIAEQESDHLIIHGHVQTTGNVEIMGATSGSVTLVPTAVAGTTTLTLPATTGTVVTTGDTGTVTQTMMTSNVAVPFAVLAATTADVGASTFSAGVLTGYDDTFTLALTTTSGSTTVTTTSTAGIKVGAAVSASALAGGTTVASITNATTFEVTPAATATSVPTVTGTFTQTIAALAVDGVTLALNDRILVKDQTTAAQNGVYYLSTLGTTSIPWVLTRTTDADTSVEMAGAVVTVDKGGMNGGKTYKSRFQTTHTINTSAMNFGRVFDSAGIDGTETIMNTTSSGSQSTLARTVVNLAEYNNQTAAGTGCIVFVAPTAPAAVMHQFEVEALLYNQNIAKFTIQGYQTLSAGAWSATKKVDHGTVSLQTRWGVTPAGRPCLIIGDVATVWSYPHVTITKALFSHTGTADSYCKGWTVTLTTDLSSYTNVTANITSSAMAVDAATVNGKTFGTFSAAGGVAFATSTTALAATAAGTSGQLLVSGGAGAPTWSNLSSVADGTYVNITGDTMSGPLTMSGSFTAPPMVLTNITLDAPVGTAPTVQQVGLTLNMLHSPSSAVNSFFNVLSVPRMGAGSGLTHTNFNSFYARLDSGDAAFSGTVEDAYAYRAGGMSTGNWQSGTLGEWHGFFMDECTLTPANGIKAFESALSNGANKFGLYMSGSAPNYLAGRVGIGIVPTTNSNALLYLGGATGTTLAGSSPSTTKNIIFISPTFDTGVTTAGLGIETALATAASTTMSELRHFNAGQGTFGAGSSIAGQFGFYAASTLTGATTNYGFYANIAESANARWGFYGNGTAPNYFNGDVRIGSTTDNGYKFEVTGTARFTENVTMDSYLAVGATPASSYGIVTGKTLSGGAGAQYAVRVANTFGSDCTAGGRGVSIALNTTAATYTMSTLESLRVDDPIKGAGNTITTCYGILVANQTVGGTNIGISSQVTAGANKWNIHASGTARNYFAGGVEVVAGTTSMTSGFNHIPAAAGAPTGAPTNPTGNVPLYFDTTGNKMYAYDGSWLEVGGGTGVTTATPSTIAGRDASADLYANNFVSSSDERLKKDIKPIVGALDTVSLLEGVTYVMKATDKAGAGVIAQQLEQVLPDLVNTDPETGMKSVNYLAIIGYLIEAIKELKQEIKR